MSYTPALFIQKTFKNIQLFQLKMQVNFYLSFSNNFILIEKHKKTQHIILNKGPCKQEYRI